MQNTYKKYAVLIVSMFLLVLFLMPFGHNHTDKFSDPNCPVFVLQISMMAFLFLVIIAADVFSRNKPVFFRTVIVSNQNKILFSQIIKRGPPAC